MYDLLIIGGGVNGCGIARDAAGRGLSVLLAERGDLAGGTSSRSSKLIHGGLRYLEQYEFRLVREALQEREVLLRIAPHIVWPLRFVLPHRRGVRPAWLIRLGLLLYDHLGGRGRLPRTRRLNLARAAEGRSLRPEFRIGFEYSDCRVMDARLVVLNALDAAAHGAEIRVGTEVVAASREPGSWQVTLRDRSGLHEARARILVNAAGPWVEHVIRDVARAESRARVRLIKGSHIIVRKFWEGAHAYILQAPDRRVVFVLPYEGDLALIGTTDVPHEGPPGRVGITAEETDYLLAAVNSAMRHQLGPGDVLATYAGIRPLYDDAAASASAVTRDYVFDLETGGGAPLLSIFGGKITTYRRLAEHALQRLFPYLPTMGPDWTGERALPGGEFADFAGLQAGLVAAYPWLPLALARHYAHAYGTRAAALLDGARGLDGLGRHFGGLLHEREARFLHATEWARAPDDVLMRRTKHALHLTLPEQTEFRRWWTETFGPPDGRADG